MRLVIEWVGKSFVLLLIPEPFVPLPHAVVGDQGRNVLFGQCFEIGFRVIAGIGGNQGLVSPQRCSCFDNREQQFLF